MQASLRKPRNRRAAASVLIAVLVPVFVGVAALSVDLGMVAIARADLQRAADAAVMASINVYAYADPDTDAYTLAAEAAADYIERNPILDDSATFDMNNGVIFGRAYYDPQKNSYNFVAGDLPTNAIRVVVTERVDYFFASLFGRDAKVVDADAIAMFVEGRTIEADCYDTVEDGKTMICHHGDSDDSDDSEAGDSDDSDDSDSGDSDGSRKGDSDDSDDSEFGDSDDSDDSQGLGDSDSSGDSNADSESGDSEFDSDAPHTVIVDTNALAHFLAKGDTIGPCNCLPGDPDDSDDSEFGDSSDSDDSDSDFFGGDPDDSDDSASGDSDDSDDSVPNDSDSDGGGEPAPKVKICHIPPGNPAAAHTLKVDASALATHLGHGDTLGECPADRKLQVFLIQ